MEKISQWLSGFTAQDLKKHHLLCVVTASDAAEFVAEIVNVLRKYRGLLLVHFEII